MINHEIPQETQGVDASNDFITRREFLEKAFKLGLLVVASEFGGLGWLINEENKGKPNKIGVPEGTHLESLPWGGYSWTDYDTATLVRMNGSLDNLGKFLNSEIIWAPGKIDGEYPETKGALRFLQGHLMARAVGEYNEENDGGWKPDDQEVVQNLLHLTVERVSAFFGGHPLWITGFIPVYRPGEDERKKIKQIFNMKDPRGGVFGNNNEGDSLHINILLGDKWKGGLNESSIEDLIQFRKFLGHEYAHAFAGPLKIPPFDNHRLVNLAGQAFYFDQLIGQDMKKLATDPETYTWMFIKTLTGEDFYAKLLQELFAKHGKASLNFSEEQVMKAGEEIFVKAGAPFSLKKMLENCPTGACALDAECGPNSYCVEGGCVPKDQFDILEIK